MRQTTFMQIFSDLHGAISDGTLLPGMPLPSENTLAQQYSTSRPTVRKAIKMLSEQSLIVRKQGIGSVVAEKKQEKPLIFGGLNLELQSSSYHYYQKIIKGISSVAESGKHKLQIISLESDLAAAAEGVLSY
ncbi:MAG: GntR family transcriptional regulator [Victivallales bacterium]